MTFLKHLKFIQNMTFQTNFDKIIFAFERLKWDEFCDSKEVYETYWLYVKINFLNKHIIVMICFFSLFEIFFFQQNLSKSKKWFQMMYICHITFSQKTFFQK